MEYYELKKEKNIYSAESVTEGHPDKLCDYISDKILDYILTLDSNAYVGCEVIISNNKIVVFGQVTSNVEINYKQVVLNSLIELGYDNPENGIDLSTYQIEVDINNQSTDIAKGVQCDEGAGDQGIMFGFACNETIEMMPLPIVLSHRLTKRLADVRKQGLVDYIRPDGKALVSVEYVNEKIKRIDNVIISIQHSENVNIEEVREFVLNNVIKVVLPNELLDEKTKYYINPTGRFVIGGPQGDSGLTGRKIMVDTYGSYARHGGGAFSGKDPSKVDRSAAYMARYIAKNLVATGLISKVEIGLSYAIGKSEPTSIFVNSYGQKFDSGMINSDDIIKMIKEVFSLKVKDIIALTWWSQPVAIFNTKNRIKDITTANQLKAISDKWCKADDLDEYDNKILEKDVLGFGVIGKRLAIEYFDKEN